MAQENAGEHSAVDIGFFKSLCEDLKALHQRPGFLCLVGCLFSSSGFLAVFLYRLSAFSYRKIGSLPAKIFKRLNVFLNSCSLHYKAVIGPGLALFHPMGVVIGEGAIIGKNVSIYQNVTIGMRHNAEGHDENLYPVLGDHVEVFSGAVIMGAIKIGNHARIGANAVVTKDVPEHATAFGVPARVIVRAT